MSPEITPQSTDSEEYLASVLSWRPPIPYGRADISTLEEQAAGLEPTEPGYAWERLPLWMAKVDEAYRASSEPIVTLDLGSSAPLYAQYLRGSEFIRDGQRAKELTSNLFSDRAFRKLRGEQGYLRPLTMAVGRDERSRQLLASALQEFLYELTPEDINVPFGQLNPLTSKIAEKIANQHVIYSDRRAGTHHENSPGMQIMRTESYVTYFEHLCDLPVPTLRSLQARQRLAQDSSAQEDRRLASETQSAGAGLAEQLIYWQAATLAEELKKDPQRYRPARFLSFDYSEPDDIALSSMVNTPESTKSMELFSHAIASLADSHQHVRGNMLAPLPFPDNSLTLITCFDSWPFHFQTDPSLHGENADLGKVALEVLTHLYEKLAYGGKLVIFPWATKRETYEEAKSDALVLDSIRTALNSRIGQFVYDGRASRSSLEKWMSVADKETAVVNSPVFESSLGLPADAEPYSALMITKPSFASAKAATKTEIQGSRDPKQ